MIKIHKKIRISEEPQKQSKKSEEEKSKKVGDEKPKKEKKKEESKTTSGSSQESGGSDQPNQGSEAPMSSGSNWNTLAYYVAKWYDNDRHGVLLVYKSTQQPNYDHQIYIYNLNMYAILLDWIKTEGQVKFQIKSDNGLILQKDRSNGQEIFDLTMNVGFEE
ncbi:MAG TPA: hypothetical protein VMV49_01420 [Candidatus Deferrimicrobium sp.]|nr:hypothetical protein [Candidatus Deferrimicrobium sp.]